MSENIYCVKCRKKTANVGGLRLAKNKQGRLMLATKCAICGTKKFRFIKKEEAEKLAGKGLLSSITGHKLPILSDIPILGDLLF